MQNINNKHERRKNGNKCIYYILYIDIMYKDLNVTITTK